MQANTRSGRSQGADLPGNGGIYRVSSWGQTNWPTDLRIRTKNGIDHTGIQKELNNVVQKAPGIQSNRDASITIRILKEVDLLKPFQFKYDTKYVLGRPTSPSPMIK